MKEKRILFLHETKFIVVKNSVRDFVFSSACTVCFQLDHFRKGGLKGLFDRIGRTPTQMKEKDRSFFPPSSVCVCVCERFFFPSLLSWHRWMIKGKFTC